MPTPLIIGAGSGLVSAALFASAATATALAGVLFYLAPLPLCLAGLGWGGMAALRRGARPARSSSPWCSGSATAARLRRFHRRAARALLPSCAVSRVPFRLRKSGRSPRSNGIRRAALSAGPRSSPACSPPCSCSSWATTRRAIANRSARCLEHSALKDLDRDGTLFTEENHRQSQACSPARFLPPSPSSGRPSPSSICGSPGVIVEASGRALQAMARPDALELPNCVSLAFAAAWRPPFCRAWPVCSPPVSPAPCYSPTCYRAWRCIHVYSRGMPFRGLLLADRLSRHSASGLGCGRRRHYRPGRAVCWACADGPRRADSRPNRDRNRSDTG